MTLAMRNTASGVIQTVKWLEYLLSLEYYNTGKGSQPIRFEDQNELLYNNILYICDPEPQNQSYGSIFRN